MKRVRERLTAAAVQKARAPGKHFDGGGLYLLVGPDGAKGWRLKYYFGGAERLMSFGPFPATDLAAARARRNAVRETLSRGEDPQADRRATIAAQAASAGLTFKAVADVYLTDPKTLQGAGAAKTVAKRQSELGHLKSLHGLALPTIKAPDVLAAVKALESAGKGETAQRCVMLVRRVYAFADVRGIWHGANPAANLAGEIVKAPVVNRAAMIEPGQVGGLVRAIEGYPEAVTRAALQVGLLTAVRSGELRGMRWRELDLEKAVWAVPEERMKVKGKGPHVVPLSRQAVAVLEAAREDAVFTDADAHVFPGLTSHGTLSENTLNSALRRLGYSKEQQTFHGFRSIFSTLMNEHEADGELIELCLAHAEKDKVRGAYNKALRFDARRALMQRWADVLDVLKTKK